MKFAAVFGAIALAVAAPAHAGWVKVCTTGHVSGAGSTSTTETICWWTDAGPPEGGSGGGSGSGSGSGGGGGGGSTPIGIHPPSSPQGVVVSLDGKKVFDPTISCGSEVETRQRAAQYSLMVKPLMSASTTITLTMDDNNHQKFQRLGPFGSDLQMMPTGPCIEPNSHPGE